jgi:hypothetical protein
MKIWQEDRFELAEEITHQSSALRLVECGATSEFINSLCVWPVRQRQILSSRSDDGEGMDRIYGNLVSHNHSVQIMQLHDRLRDGRKLVEHLLNRNLVAACDEQSDPAVRLQQQSFE